MQRYAPFAAPIALLLAIGFGIADDENGKDQTTTVGDRPKVRESLTESTSRTRQADSRQPAPDGSPGRQMSEGEREIRKTAEAYAKAFSAGDAKAAAAQFTDDAEYIDPQGIVYEGRQSIEDLLKTFFDSHPDRKMEIAIDAVRFPTPTIAIEDGVTRISTDNQSQVLSFRYTAVHTKTNERWMTASVRDRVANDSSQHTVQLRQLDWLLGNWVHEGRDAVVHFSCRPVENGSYLERKFTVHVAGQQSMSGTQRIGWDPQTGKFRVWVFDSQGGYAEGFWHRDDAAWILKLSGVTPDGRSASNTSIYTFTGPRTMSFQSLNHEVGGVELPDSDPITIVRQMPPSEQHEQF